MKFRALAPVASAFVLALPCHAALSVAAQPMGGSSPSTLAQKTYEERHEVLPAAPTVELRFGLDLALHQGRVLVARDDYGTGPPLGGIVPPELPPPATRMSAATLHDADSGALIREIAMPGGLTFEDLDMHGDRGVFGLPFMDLTLPAGPDMSAAMVVDMRNGAVLHRLYAPPGAAAGIPGFAQSVAIDDRFVVAAFPSETGDSTPNAIPQGALYVFDAASGALRRRLALPGERLLGEGGLAIDNGRLVARVSGPTGARSLVVFDLSTGALLARLTPPLIAQGSVHGFDISGDLVVTATGTSVLYDAAVMEISTGNVLRTLPLQDSVVTLNGARVAIDGGLVAVSAPDCNEFASDGGLVSIYDLDTGLQLASFSPVDTEIDDYFGVALGLDQGRVVATSAMDDSAGTNSGALFLFDAYSEVGSAFCVLPTTNSTGQPARLTAYGSDEVDLRRLSFVVSSLPPGVAYLPMVSPVQANLPLAGSQGTLCLGGAAGRYDTVALGPNRSAGITFADPSSTPASQGPIPILPGQTWSFQIWYRDRNPSTTSNFTNAVQVLFR